jgi:hypothetical protein
MRTLNPNLRLELLNYMSDLNLYNLPYVICTCTVGCMYLFLSALTPILILIACTQRNTPPYVVVSGVELISDTFTVPLVQAYNYRRGSVIQSSILVRINPIIIRTIRKCWFVSWSTRVGCSFAQDQRLEAF